MPYTVKLRSGSIWSWNKQKSVTESRIGIIYDAHVSGKQGPIASTASKEAAQALVDFLNSLSSDLAYDIVRAIGVQAVDEATEIGQHVYERSANERVQASP